MSPAVDPYQILQLCGTFIPFYWVFICKGLFTLICFYSGVFLDSTTLSTQWFSSLCHPFSWACPSSNCSIPLPPFIPTDSDNSLLRYLSDDKILVIEEEPEGPGRESRRDSTRRSRRKSRNPSSPSFPISPSMLSSTLRLDQPPDPLPVRTQLLNWVFKVNFIIYIIYVSFSCSLFYIYNHLLIFFLHVIDRMSSIRSITF